MSVGLQLWPCMRWFCLSVAFRPTALKLALKISWEQTATLLGYSMLASATIATLLPVVPRFVFTILLYPVQVAYLVRWDGGLGWDALVGPTFLLVFNLTLVASLTMLYNRAGRLDDAIEELEVQTKEAAKAEATQVARRRVDAYIHDSILSALDSASKGVADRDQVQNAAQDALRSLDSIPELVMVMTPTQLFSTIERASRARCGALEIDVVIDRRTSQALIGPELASALIYATAEALTNSLKHARREDGREVSRSLLMSAEEDRIRIVLKDDGDGCLTEDMGSRLVARHGIRVSIIGRMEDVGGRATVNCGQRGPRQGVRVTLSWERNSLANSAANVLPIDQGTLAETLYSKTARSIAMFAIGGTVLMMIGNAENYSTLIWPTLAVVWQSLIAMLLMRPEPAGSVAKWPKWLAIVSVALSNLLVLVPITVPGYPSYAAWSLGTGWLLSVLLLFRYGPATAWAAMGAMGFTTLLWAVVFDRGPGVAIELMVGQVVALTIWTVVAWWSNHLMVSVAATELETRESESGLLASQTTLAMLELRLTALTDRVRPTLVGLAGFQSLSPSLRTAAALLEGELRDQIRAPSLSDRRLVAAVREARSRGVEVVLLDDRGPGPLADELLKVICARSVRILERTTEGRVVIRLLPASREAVASIVAPTTTMTIIQADALPQPPNSPADSVFE